MVLDISHNVYNTTTGKEGIMKFTTTKEQEEFRMKVRHFAEEEVKPIAFLLDKENQFPQGSR